MSWILTLALVGCGDPEPPGDREVAVLPEQPGRAWRRMDIDQVRASLETLSGGIAWAETVQGRPVNLFDTLSGSLGKPEYLDSTVEDLVPGLLFQKFLDDAAKFTCTELIERESSRSGSDRIFVTELELDDTATDSAAVERTLSQLLLSWHGTEVSPGDPALEPWTTLVDTVLSDTGDPEKAWRAVCVALAIHPDFYAL